ncbi:phasin family protein [Simplicispira psychrophila]|uniref:phasin family protein n=1 Tax=Simplicispira psychrophila TaxID=80882 RepID=UPI00055E6BEE|nr:phasin family protein [Simplicispira psychrophila]
MHPQSASAPGSASALQQTTEKSTSGALPWSHLADLQRQQLALATECASAVFRGVESMRKIQQEAAHQASAHHATATQQLRSPEPTADLMALLSTPLRVDMEGVQKYWNQLAAATFQAQAEMMNSICHMFNNENRSSVSSIQEVVQATMPPLASSFFVDGAHEHPHQP